MSGDDERITPGGSVSGKLTLLSNNSNGSSEDLLDASASLDEPGSYAIRVGL